MSQGKGHRAVGEPKEPRRQQLTGGSRENTAAASGQLLASRRKHSHQQQLEAHQAAWDSPDPTHPVHSPRHQPTERAAFCWVIFSTDQSTEAQETTEVFFLNKKPQKPLHTDVNRLDTRSRGTGIQTGRIPGSCQSHGWISGTCKEAEGREGGTASSMLFLWESEAGSTADAVTHGGILPGIINLALLTAP